MQKFEHGVVKFFDSRDNKRFGFISLEAGEEIFFHFNDGRRLYFEDDGELTSLYPKVEHISTPGLHQIKKDYGLSEPKPGDVVYFIRERGYKGAKASPWTSEAIFDKWLRPKLEEDEKRLSVVYRCLKQTTFWNSAESDNGEPELVFEGNLDELNAKYPPPRSGTSDSLLSFFSHDDGFQVRRWFEKKTKDGTWERCEDPRNLPGVLRQFERINW